MHLTHEFRPPTFTSCAQIVGVLLGSMIIVADSRPGVAYPQMQKDLSAAIEEIGFLFSTCAAALTMSTLATLYVGERFGTVGRMSRVAGTGAAAAFVSGGCDTMQELLAARVAQRLSAGLVLALSLPVSLRMTAPSLETKFVVILWTSCLTADQVGVPLTNGALAEKLRWQAVFGAAGAGSVVVAVPTFGMPGTPTGRRKFAWRNVSAACRCAGGPPALRGDASGADRTGSVIFGLFLLGVGIPFIDTAVYVDPTVLRAVLNADSDVDRKS